MPRSLFPPSTCSPINKPHLPTCNDDNTHSLMGYGDPTIPTHSTGIYPVFMNTPNHMQVSREPIIGFNTTYTMPEHFGGFLSGHAGANYAANPDARSFGNEQTTQSPHPPTTFVSTTATPPPSRRRDNNQAACGTGPHSLKCGWVGCTYTRSFNRAEDLV
ncbi:hypothetical protein BO78DRAFT_467847, partial [Aspergillus sclerotiicarbonarius CBS 121057]